MDRPDERAGRAQLERFCHLAYSRGYVCGTEGNLSLRLDDGNLLSTPSGSCKGNVYAGSFVVTDMEGRLITKRKDGIDRKPSTELKMHLVAYALRPDISAIVHAHPTVTVALTVAGKKISTPILPEIVCTLGSIPVASYATPSTDEVTESLTPYLEESDAIVMDHHGAITLGITIDDAFCKMEMLEHHSQTLLIAELLGGAVPLSSESIAKLMAIRSVYGLTRPVRI